MDITVQSTNHPKALPNQLCDDEAGKEGVHRFMNNDHFGHEDLLDGHRDGACERAAHADLVLALTDESHFSFAIESLGEDYKMTKGKYGFVGLCTLLVGVQGDSAIPLGVAGLHARRKQDAGHEHWHDQVVAVAEYLDPVPSPVVHVMDSEMDSYRLLAGLAQTGDHYVIRLKHDRVLGADEEAHKLFDELEQAPVHCRRRVHLSRRDRTGLSDADKAHPPRDERMAELEVRATPVTIRRPKGARTWLPDELTLHVVHVVEPDPPDGVEGVDWKLATLLPIDETQAVADIVDIYCRRWLIEEFFKAVKTGCAYNKAQQRSIEALLRVLVLKLPLATHLLATRYLSRNHPELPAEILLDDLHLAALRFKVPEKFVPAEGQLTIAEVTRGIAWLGHHNRWNGPPGWIVLGRGLKRLRDMAEMFASLQEQGVDLGALAGLEDSV